MRRAWLILLGAVVAMTVPAQDHQSATGGIVMRDFTVNDAPCGYKHDISVEKVLQSVRVVIDPANPSRASSAATLELRNNSAKTITAYIFNHTFTHGGKTDFHGTSG